MMDYNILSKNEILCIGMHFDGEIVDYGGEYYQELCDSSSGNIIPITGIVYEQHSNGNIAYYCGYKDGIKDGDYVGFYDDGSIEFFVPMCKGASHGHEAYWYKNGNLKSEAFSKYGYITSQKEWDEEGALINDIAEPNDLAKEMIKKYESMEKNENSQP